jgi:Family of unknown function (DUF6165)
MPDILVPISPGELLDKITILRIKARRMDDAAKLVNVRRELALLEGTWEQTAAGSRVGESAADLAAEMAALEAVNAALWDIEDHIRECEAQARFDARFVELARSVYLRNDERAGIKKRINLLLGSAIVEEKSYRAY